jgi:hypothetical protein
VALSLCSTAERPLLLAIERLTRRRLERRAPPAGLAASTAPMRVSAR